MAVLAGGGEWSHPQRNQKVWDSKFMFVPFYRAKDASLYKEATYRYVQPSYFLCSCHLTRIIKGDNAFCYPRNWLPGQRHADSYYSKKHFLFCCVGTTFYIYYNTTHR